MYYNLKITAEEPDTEIWLSAPGEFDGEIIDHLVQKEIGVMNTSIVPGDYYVCFGPLYKNMPKHLVQVKENISIRERSYQK